jgi:hypothetical protein
MVQKCSTTTTQRLPAAADELGANDFMSIVSVFQEAEDMRCMRGSEVLANHQSAGGLIGLYLSLIFSTEKVIFYFYLFKHLSLYARDS